MSPQEKSSGYATKRLPGAILVLSLVSSIATAQSVTPQAPHGDDEKHSELIHWTEVLNRIVFEAKTLPNTADRPEVLIAIADAFWDLDKKKSRELFSLAVDQALSVESRRVRNLSLRRLMVAAAKRDLDLAKDLAKRLQEKDDSEAGVQTLTAASDLVDIDVKAAEALALANTSNGPSFETASLIFELHKQSPAAAGRVYLAYLASLHDDDPSQLLWLAGYPFGFHEALGGSIEPLQLIGVFGLTSSGLSANSALAQAFLSTATRTIERILRQSSALPPQQAETYKALAFFTLSYLSPQVERYRPDLAPRWLSLQQSVGAGLDFRRRAQILKKVATIAASRAQAGTRTDEQKLTSGEELLADVEKLSSCQRDLSYARAALHSSYRSDFKKALSLVESVSDLKLRSNALQFLFFDISLSVTSPRASGNLDEGLAYAQRVDTPEHRSFLYLKLAEFAARDDRGRARVILNDVLKICDRIEDQSFQAALLFAASLQLLKLETPLPEIFPIMEKAIHLLSNDKQVRIDQISLVRRLEMMGCDGSTPQWYGDFNNLGQFNVIETLVQISEIDAGVAEQLASDLPTGSNQIRSLAAVATAQIKRLQRR